MKQQQYSELLDGARRVTRGGAGRDRFLQRVEGWGVLERLRDALIIELALNVRQVKFAIHHPSNFAKKARAGAIASVQREPSHQATLWWAGDGIRLPSPTLAAAVRL